MPHQAVMNIKAKQKRKEFHDSRECNDKFQTEQKKEKEQIEPRNKIKHYPASSDKRAKGSARSIDLKPNPWLRL